MIKLIKAKIVNLFHYLYFWNAYFFSKVEKRIGNKSDVINYNYNDIDIINDSILLNNIPKVIWVFWYDENIPDLVQKCILNIRRINFDYEVKLLNKKNIVEYLDLNIDVLREKMPLANLSDLIRLKLLSKYGGVWMDASIILEEKIDNFFLPTEVRYDIIAYYNNFQSIGAKIPVIESWLLAAPKGSKFIDKWLYYFEPIALLGNIGLFDNYKKNNKFDELCKGLGDPLYLVVYIAAKLAYEDLKEDSNILLYPCDNSAFSVQIASEWRTRKCTKSLYIEEKHFFSPIYKLTSGDRKYYNFLKKYNIINDNSIIGNFLNRMK